MIKSRLSSKAQTTIPQSVRTALGLNQGDDIAYEIHGGVVTLTKASVVGVEDPFATFDEWNSEADRKAYADL
jgi:antitoxin PrlF